MANITWYGHAALKIEIADKTLYIDPFLQNPMSTIKANDITEADLVYVTHDHPDHLGDAFDICKRTGATFAAPVELADQASPSGVNNVARLDIGGSYNIGNIKLTVTQAVHSAAKGTPTGVMIQGEGINIYDSGDTALFGDMRLLGERYLIDLACLPIGGNYTMDIEQAAEAANLLKPSIVFPMHYASFPQLAKDTSGFRQAVRKLTHQVKVIELAPGKAYHLEPQRMKASAV